MLRKYLLTNGAERDVWLNGTHAGVVRDKHLQAHLDEFAFRHNHRKTNGTMRSAARVVEASSPSRYQADAATQPPG